MDRVPIADLAPSLPAPHNKYIRAVVTLVWPYSSSTRQCALLLADPDYRLRRKKGQVRVRLAGPSAKAVAQAEIGIGDTVSLSLEGAQWLEDRGEIRTPGKSVDWELKFNQRVVIEAIREAQGPVKVDIDHPAPSPEIPTSPVAHVTPVIPRLSPPLTQKRVKRTSDQWSSPAFLKHKRLSDGVFFEAGYDPLVDSEDLPLEGGRKKSRLSWKGVDKWRYVDRSPSPERDGAQTAGTEGRTAQSVAPKAARDLPHIDKENWIDPRRSLGERVQSKPRLTFEGQPTFTPTRASTRVSESLSTPTNGELPLQHEAIMQGATKQDPTEEAEVIAASSEVEEIQEAVLKPTRKSSEENMISVDEVSAKSEPKSISESDTEQEATDKMEVSDTSLAEHQAIQGPPSPTKSDDRVAQQPRVVVLSDSEEESEESGSEEEGDYDRVLEEQPQMVVQDAPVMMPPPTPALPRLNTNISQGVSHGLLQTPIDSISKPITPTLEPVPSPSLPLPSPFPGNSGYQGFFGVPVSPGPIGISGYPQGVDQSYVPVEDTSQHAPATVRNQLYSQPKANEFSLDGVDEMPQVASVAESFGDNEVPSLLENESFVVVSTKDVEGGTSPITQEDQPTNPAHLYPELPEMNIEERREATAPTKLSEVELESPTLAFSKFLNSDAFSDTPLSTSESPSRRTTAATNAGDADVHYPALPRQEVTPPPTMGSTSKTATASVEQIADPVNHPMTPEHSQQHMSSQSLHEANRPATEFPPTPRLTQTATDLSVESAASANEKSNGIQIHETRTEPVENNVAKAVQPASPKQAPVTKTLEKETPPNRRDIRTPSPTREPKPSPQTNGKTTPASLTRQTTGLRTSTSYYTPLSHLFPHLNAPAAHVDLLALVTRAAKPPQRAPAGPRDFHTTLTLTDRSVWPDTVSAQVFRPFKAALPQASAGDVVLLRGVRVVSRKGKVGVRSDDGSGWAVWRFRAAEEEGRPQWAKKRGDADGDGAVEVKGPPVEFGEEEEKEAHALREWWEGWYANKVNGLGSPIKTRGAARKEEGKAS